MRKRTSLKHEQKKIATTTIEFLLSKASMSSVEEARTLVTKARKTGQRANVRLTREQKRTICTNCNSYLTTGKNCTIRTREGKLVITCNHCKHSKRIPLQKKERVSTTTRHKPL